MAHNVTLIPGDGTGPEIMEATRRAIEATGVQINWDVQDAGIHMLEEHGTPLPDAVLESIKRNKVAIKGPITTPIGKGFRSVNVALRKVLDLYTNLRPCKTYKGVRSRYDKIDLVVVRENTEDLYAGVEFQFDEPQTKDLIRHINSLGAGILREDAAISIKSISVFGSRRIVKYAFDYARANNRKKVTIVHKANIMKFSDGLFLQVGQDVAKAYPEIEVNDLIVDNMCMQLVQKPELYDVLVMPNLYGDILSDLCAGLVGGLGVAPGANIGEMGAVFEPIHGSAPKYAGQNKVNPTAAMLSGVMMLRHLQERDAAERLDGAIAHVIAEGRRVTYDLKPQRDDPTAVGTAEFADAIIEAMNR
ncbi:MAG: isocitrate/isopropylmalate dehydrogenase family protein [Chloroflexi bacterium]|nr:isocitrate/isopropylmalate dehydrogenase family protein [Chloroflexota bacterium]